MTSTQRATFVAAVVAGVAMLLLVAASFSENAVLTWLGIAALVAVPVARNVVIVAVGEPTDRWLALLGIVLVAVVATAVVVQR